MNTRRKLLKLEPLSSPVGDMIASVGRGVADAQRELDRAALETIDHIYSDEGKTARALREIGYRPTWYQIPEVNAELKIAMSIEGVHESNSGSAPSSEQDTGPHARRTLLRIQRPLPRIRIRATPVEASYCNKFDYEVEASSKISFRVVPIPAPGEAEDLVPVPDLASMKITDAADLLRNWGLRFEIRDKKDEQLPLSEVPDDAVVDRQEPDQGTEEYLRRGNSVTLWIDQ